MIAGRNITEVMVASFHCTLSGDTVPVHPITEDPLITALSFGLFHCVMALFFFLIF